MKKRKQVYKDVCKKLVPYVQGRGDPELENLMDDYVQADRIAVKRD